MRSLNWYGYTRTLFVYDFIKEILLRVGFDRIRRCGYQETASRYPEIVELDNREDESLFVEAVKMRSAIAPPERSALREGYAITKAPANIRMRL